ncbi:MAG: Lrp/AsnC family transcriptional regulator [SAR324 cluster bacterium]|nr:Lrp/AsnC family transcriptional regulator [SAR324 cluster bacterium]
MSHVPDEIDLKILKILQKDGRLPNSELAQQVFLSPSQCLRRLRHLEKTGVIKSYAALLDSQAIGLGVQAFVYVTLEKNGQDAADAFAEAIQNWEEILECWAVTGEEDYLLRAIAPNLDEFSNFLLKKLLGLSMVGGVRSNILLRELKDSTIMPLKHLI